MSIFGIIDTIKGDIKDFVNDFTDKFGLDTEAEITKLSAWERTHFANHYTIYRDDAGKRIELWCIPLPNAEKKRGLRKLFSSSKGPALSSLIIQFRDNISDEVQNFRSNVYRLRKMDKSLRQDPVFDKINHLFCSRLKILNNELVFCRFEDMTDSIYFNQVTNKLSAVHGDIKTLNKHFSEYMYLLSRIKYEDNKQDLEMIKISVEAMSDAVNQTY